MSFGVSSGIPNVIIHAKFNVDRLRGFWAAGPPKVPFPILIGTTLTTVLHYRADCDNMLLIFCHVAVCKNAVLPPFVTRRFAVVYSCILSASRPLYESLNIVSIKRVDDLERANFVSAANVVITRDLTG